MALLTERHNNVANDINSNVKRLLKDFVAHIKETYGEIIEEEYDDVKTDYDYIVACIQLASHAVLEKNRKELPIFSTNFEVSIRNRKTTLPVIIVAHNEKDKTIAGGFSTDDNEDDPEIVIYLCAHNIVNTNIEQGRKIVNNLVKTLSHEITHCYQWMSKSNYQKGEAAESVLPQGFSYVVYYIKQSEIEAVCSSAYSYYKKRKKSMSYMNALCRVIDFALSEKDNDISDDELTPTYLQKKYKKNDEVSNEFMFNYFMSAGVTKTRYYKLIASESDYKEAVSNTEDTDHEEIKNVLDDIFSIASKQFDSNPDFNAGTAYWLLSNKESARKLYTSLDYALSVLDQIKTNDFGDTEVVDEEEDNVVHGRDGF